MNIHCARKRDKIQGKPYCFKDIPFKIELIYRASRDGFSVNNFHNKCDNKGPTIVVIKVRNSKDIIGGYNPLDWRSVKIVEDILLSNNDEIYHDHRCKTSNSFIFSLKNRAIPILSRVSSKKEAIIWSGNKGPCFGLQDLWIQDESRSFNNIVGKNKQHSYEEKIIDEETFEIEEYEVFQIIDERFSFLDLFKIFTSVLLILGGLLLLIFLVYYLISLFIKTNIGYKILVIFTSFCLCICYSHNLTWTNE